MTTAKEAAQRKVRDLDSRLIEKEERLARVLFDMEGLKAELEAARAEREEARGHARTAAQAAERLHAYGSSAGAKADAIAAMREVLKAVGNASPAEMFRVAEPAKPASAAQVTDAAQAQTIDVTSSAATATVAATPAETKGGEPSAPTGMREQQVQPEPQAEAVKETTDATAGGSMDAADIIASVMGGYDSQRASAGERAEWQFSVSASSDGRALKAEAKQSVLRLD